MIVQHPFSIQQKIFLRKREQKCQCKSESKNITSDFFMKMRVETHPSLHQKRSESESMVAIKPQDFSHHTLAETDCSIEK